MDDFKRWLSGTFDRPARALERLFPVLLALLLSATWLAPGARADAKAKAAREVVEYAARRFGWRVGREGIETAAKKLETHTCTR